VVKEYTKEIEEYTPSLLEIPHLVLITITTDHTLLALDLMRKYGVFPRDSIHESSRNKYRGQQYNNNRPRFYRY